MTLRCWQLAIPFRSKFTHNRKSRSVSSTFWVQAEQDGMVGFGEGCPRPYVTGETLDQCQLFFNRHSKQVSAAITDLPSLKAYRKNHEMDIAANPAAWCAIELALLDLIARLQQVPVERLLGLPDLSGSFRYTGVLGVDAPEAFARKLQAHRSLGMHDYKLKWNADNASSRARLEQIQSAVPGVMIRIDANNLWPSAAAAIQELKALADSVWAVEEPLCLPSLQDALNIARQTGVRIILDEAVLNERDLLPYLDYAEHFILNLRVSKCGGVLSSSGDGSTLPRRWDASSGWCASRRDQCFNPCRVARRSVSRKPLQSPRGSLWGASFLSEMLSSSRCSLEREEPFSFRINWEIVDGA